MSKILVTGGAGFIGSHIAETFIKAGHTVGILDNLSTGKKPNIPADAEFFETDITDKDALDRVFGEFKPEVVDHHAAQISVNRSVREPYFDAEQNILGTINLLETSSRQGVRRFMFASTGGALYGDAPVIPSPEDTPVVPLAPYGIAKASVEHYIRFFSSEHSMEAVVFRYANVYGPRQDPNGEAGVVAIFTHRALSGEGFVVYGNGEQTRDFIFVRDIAEANLLGVDGKPGIYNIGTSIETSIKSLIREFERLRPGLQITQSEARPGEVLRSALDAGKAARDLGWKPKMSLSEGITETYNWFKDRTK
ncbi:NAD-dependent epimerase/dehydratase family protein [candidate division WOR-3 bacterium]|nr:NAD-dependent epimerase/dehydratase family protein [candidate division WOR-3 bacterium]